MRDFTEREDLILKQYPIKIELKPNPQSQTISNNHWDQPITYHIKLRSSSKARGIKNLVQIFNLTIIGKNFQSLNQFFCHEGIRIDDGLDAINGVYESRHQTRLIMEKYGFRFDNNEYSTWWACKDPWNRLLHECPTATRPAGLWHDKEATESYPQPKSKKSKKG